MAFADPNDFEPVGNTAVADPNDFEVVGQPADPNDFEPVSLMEEEIPYPDIKPGIPQDLGTPESEFAPSLAASAASATLNTLSGATRILANTEKTSAEYAKGMDDLITGTIEQRRALEGAINKRGYSTAEEDQQVRDLNTKAQKFAGEKDAALKTTHAPERDAEKLARRKGPEATATELGKAAGSAYNFYTNNPVLGIIPPGYANPESQNPAAQIGRATGTVLNMGLTMAAGLPVLAGAAGAEAFGAAYNGTEKQLRASGEKDEEKIKQQALAAGQEAAIKTAPGLFAYMVGGKLAAKAVASLIPETAGITAKVLAGTAGATVSNIATGTALRAIEGENWQPTIQTLTMDTLLGAFHGYGEWKGASAKAKMRVTEELTRRARLIEQTPPEELNSALEKVIAGLPKDKQNSWKEIQARAAEGEPLGEPEIATHKEVLAKISDELMARKAGTAEEEAPPSEKPPAEPDTQTIVSPDVVDGLVRARDKLMQGLDALPPEVQQARHEPLAVINEQLGRFAPEMVSAAEERARAPKPPTPPTSAPDTVIPSAGPRREGGTSPLFRKAQEEAAAEAAKLTEAAASAAETSPRAAAEGVKLGADIAAEIEKAEPPPVEKPPVEDKAPEPAKAEEPPKEDVQLAPHVEDALKAAEKRAEEGDEIGANNALNRVLEGIPNEGERNPDPDNISDSEWAKRRGENIKAADAIRERVKAVKDKLENKPVPPTEEPAPETPEPTLSEERINKLLADLEDEAPPKPAPAKPEAKKPTPEPAKPAVPEEPAMRIVPRGTRFQIVNAADEQVGKRTYETEARAARAMEKIGQRSTFGLPPSANGHDIIDTIQENFGKINISKMSPEEFRHAFPHKGIWLTRIFTKRGGAAPSSAAQALAPSEGKNAAGELSFGDGHEGTMMEEINKAVLARISTRDQGKASVSNQRGDAKKAAAFERSISKPGKGKDALPVSEFKMGEEIQVGGETLKVTEIDPDTGDVTLSDGKKYGAQTVTGDRVIYAEKTKTDESDPLAAWEALDTADVEEFSTQQKLIDETKPAPEPSPEEQQAADSKGPESVPEPAPTAGGTAPEKVAETPLAKARRVLEERRKDQAEARDEGDYELAASLARVIPKLERDLAAEEQKASTPVEPAPEAPAEPVEMWQRKREAVGEQLAKHREEVKNAVKAGKPVPDEVLAEYGGSAWADREIAKRAKAVKEATKAVTKEPEAVTEPAPKPAAEPPAKSFRQLMDENAAKQKAEDEAITKARLEGTEKYTPSIRLPNGQIVKSRNANEGHGELAQLYPELKVTKGFFNNRTQKFLTTMEVAREGDSPDAPLPMDVGTTNTGTSANVSNEEGGTLVRVGGQVVAKLNQKGGEFVPELNEAGAKLTDEQKAFIDQAAKDYTKTWQRAKVKEGAAKTLGAADVTTQLDMLESGRSETPLFEGKPKDKLEKFLEKLDEDLKSKPGDFFSDPLFIQSVGKPVLRAAVKIVLEAYRAGKKAVEAIEEGLAYLRANVKDLDEDKAREFFKGTYEQTPEQKAAEAAKPEASAPEKSPTGIRNAIVDRERVARGLPERMAPLRRTFARLWDEAMQVVDADPQAGSKLVAKITKEPRPLDDWESALLAHEQVTRQHAFDRAMEKVNENPGDPEAIAELRDARTSIQEVYDAGQLVGTESGRSLAARKLLINDDYTLAQMEATMRAEGNDGKPLSEEQEKTIKELHDRIAASDKKIAEYEAKEKEAETKRVYEQVLKEAKKEASTAAKTGGKISSFIHSQAEKAKARIAERRKSGKLFATIDPLNLPQLIDHTIIGADYLAQKITRFADWSAKMLADFGEDIRPVLKPLFDQSKEYYESVAQGMGKSGPVKETSKEVASTVVPGEALDPSIVFKLARAHVREGVEGMENVMKAVHQDLLPHMPELTEREVRDAFSGYGKITYPSKEADLTALREYRNLARLTSQLEDAQKGLAPLKTGPQRDKQSQKVRELTGLVKETMRKLGITTTTAEQQLKTSLDAVKTRLKNQIEDINKQIATKTKPASKTPIPYDEEATALRAERDRLSGILEEIFGKPQLTDEQRIAAANKALDKAIAEEDAMLKQGILKRAPKESKTPADPGLESKRSMLDSMRDLRRELHEAQNPKASPEEAALENALKAAQASIDRYDEMLKTGKLAPEAKPAKFTPTDELETLWNERNALRDAVSELRKEARPHKSKEEQARQAALKSLDKRLAELDRRLKTGDFSDVPKSEGKASKFADVQEKRAEVAAVRKLYDDLKKAQLPKRSEDEIRLSRETKLIKTRTAELERRIAAGEYEPRAKKPELMSKEKADAMLENAKAKEAFNRGKFEASLKNRGIGKRIYDRTKETLNTARAIQTSFDLSAVLRQGTFIALAHPARASRSIVPMLKAFISEREALRTNQEIHDRPNAPLYEQAKLFLSDQHDISLNKMEERFMSRWIERSELKPGESVKNGLRRVKNIVFAPVRGSARAYTTFLNKLRADSFDAMAATLSNHGTVTTEEARAIANFINVATGRGAVHAKFANAAVGMNSLFFAPRYVTSRFQLLAGQPLYGGTTRTRALIAGEYGRFLIGAGLVYALAMAAQDSGDKDLELDTTSSDFGKIQFGNTRLDPMGGLLQETVFLSRETKALARTLSGSTEKNPEYGGGGDVLGRFLRSKLNPALGTIVDLLAGQDVTGQKITLPGAAQRMMTPLTFNDILGVMEENGIPKGTAISILVLLGMGAQTYDKEKNKQAKMRMKLSL